MYTYTIWELNKTTGVVEQTSSYETDVKYTLPKFNPLVLLAPEVQKEKDIAFNIILQDIYDRFADSVLNHNKLPDDWDEIRMARYLPRLAIDGKTTVYSLPANLVIEFHEVIHNEKKYMKRERVTSRLELVKIIAMKYNLNYAHL